MYKNMTKGSLNIIVGGVRYLSPTLYARSGVHAAAHAYGIGQDGGLPWGSVREDMRLFRRFTAGKYRTPHFDFTCAPGDSAVIMGRNTWKSLPVPVLPGRQNVVVSGSLNPECVAGELTHETLHCVPDVSTQTLDLLQSMYAHCWVIGGQRLYEAVLSEHAERVDHVVLMELAPRRHYLFDTFFPSLDGDERFRLRYLERVPVASNPEIDHLMLKIYEGSPPRINRRG